MIKIVQQGQTLMDMAIQYFGSAAALVDLAKANNLALDADVQPGQKISIADTYPASAIPVFANYINTSGKVVVSDGTEALQILITNNGESLEGIIV